MPFGVTNVPSQFMHMINDVIAGYLDVFRHLGVLPYYGGAC